MKNESPTSWLFLMSAIYLAPHCDKWYGILLGGLFGGLACLVWVAELIKD